MANLKRWDWYGTSATLKAFLESGGRWKQLEDGSMVQWHEANAEIERLQRELAEVRANLGACIKMKCESETSWMCGIAKAEKERDQARALLAKACSLLEAPCYSDAGIDSRSALALLDEIEAAGISRFGFSNVGLCKPAQREGDNNG